jgi:hypothetical protein
MHTSLYFPFMPFLNSSFELVPFCCNFPLLHHVIPNREVTFCYAISFIQSFIWPTSTGATAEVPSFKRKVRQSQDGNSSIPFILIESLQSASYARFYVLKMYKWSEGKRTLQNSARGSDK